MSERLTVKQRLTTQDEGVGHEGRCHGCGTVYKSAVFVDQPQGSAHIRIECPCGRSVEMARIGVVRHRSALAPVHEPFGASDGR